MGNDPLATWKRKIEWYSENNHVKDMNRIDGTPTEFEWKIFSEITTMGILNQIQQMMGELQCEPENFTGWIIFMSMFNDIEWKAKGNTISTYAPKFPHRHWSFLEHGSEKKWYGTHDDKRDGSWDRNAGKMLLNFAEYDHPVVRGTSALEMGDLRSKRSGKKSIHFNGSNENIELLF